MNADENRLIHMSSEEEHLFKILDDYAKARHQCFVAEMSANSARTEYIICFRPLNVTIDSASRSVCRYWRISVDEAKSIAGTPSLPAPVRQKLDEALIALA